uniref:Retrotransposon gag domain-containing protein n=1 Tax=Tanacetum cinerariifolium TaxID=118510 RepID=A0A699HSV6_TANCI|nr:hypothetical protein [Tanacetum cinerariifolium]
MSTRSSTRNLFPPLDNLELTIRRRSRVDPTLLNDFEMATEGNGDPPSIKVNGVTDDALRLYLFPHSLTHHATAWFDRLPKNSVNTFEQMAKMFLGKYFPPSMVTKLRNKITNFRQHTFYNALTLKHRDTINAAAGGTFMKRRPEECYDLIENMTAHHNDWDTSTQRSESSSSITSSSDTKITALKAEMAKINKNLMRVLQVNQQVKAVTPNCETCGGPHSYTDCPATVGQTQNGNNQRRNQFFQGASHGQNPPPAYQALAYQAPGLKTLPGNTITNSKEELKGITTHRGTAYQGPTIPTTSFSLPPVVERETETETPILNSKPDVAPIIEPVIAPVNLNFNISFADALILMPKFGPTIKTLLTNKDKLYELARTPLNEHCSAVLRKKLLEKLGDPGKFFIPCDFLETAECLALADLGASINLMPLSVWNKLSLPEHTPTLMTLKLANRLISRPIGVAKDVYVKVGKFHFPADFVVVDFDVYVKTKRALIDVFERELTLLFGKEAITFNLDQTSRYSANCNDMTANRIDVIDMAFDAFLALEDDPTSPEVDQSYFDPKGDILLLETFLNDDPSLSPPTQGNYLPQVRKELKICEAKTDKSSID